MNSLTRRAQNLKQRGIEYVYNKTKTSQATIYSLGKKEPFIRSLFPHTRRVLCKSRLIRAIYTRQNKS